MADKQPTEAQIKEFWERCGIHCHKWEGREDDLMGAGRCQCGESEMGFEDGGKVFWYKSEIPYPIDLNNLFKYAVPKLVEQDYEVTVRCFQAKWEVTLFAGKQPFNDSEIKDVEDPALALFWAIWEVKADA